MSIGALGVMTLGIYLVRHPGNQKLAAKLFGCGIVLGLGGLALLRVDRGNFGALADGDDMGLWRWPVYARIVLVLASSLTFLLDHYARMPQPMKKLLHLAGILGLCSLLVYVLHGLVF